MKYQVGNIVYFYGERTPLQINNIDMKRGFYICSFVSRIFGTVELRYIEKYLTDKPNSRLYAPIKA